MRLPDQLPPLKGVVYGAYRVLGAVLILLFALIGTVGDYAYQTHSREMAQAFYAAGVRNIGSPNGGVWVAPFSPEAHAAGLPKGRLLAVDGTGLAGLGPASAALGGLLAGPEGAPIVLRVAAGGAAHDYSLTRSSRYLRDAYSGTGISFAGRKLLAMGLDIASNMLMAAVLALLYLRRPRDPVAALIVIGGGLLQLQPLPVLAASFPGSMVIPAGAGELAGHAGMLLFFSAMMIFPAGRFRPPRWTPLAWAMVLAVGLALFVPEVSHAPFIEAAAPPVMAALAVAVLAARFRSSPPGMVRQQLKWAALGLSGLGLFLSLQVVTDAWAEGASSEGVRAWLVLLSVLNNGLAALSISACFLVALLRYRLYDAETAISRSAVFALLTLSLLGIFAGAEKIVEALGEQYFGASLGALAGGLAAALAAITIAPLHGRLSRWAERRFRHDLIRLRRDLPVLLADLRESETPDEVAARVLAEVAGLLRAKVGALALDGGPAVLRDISPEAFAAWREAWAPPAPERLDCDRADPLLPVRLPLHADGFGRQGWLLLGPRPDGSLYGRDEREALGEVSAPIARALAISARRAAEASSVKTAVDRLDRRMTSLETLMSRLAAAPANSPARG